MTAKEIEVRIFLNGEWASPLIFTLEEGVTVDTVKKDMRETYGVINGVLSSRKDRIQVVNSLTAGDKYYFLEFAILNKVTSQLAIGK